MSSAKWHPANLEFGWAGDYGKGHEGSPEERAAHREAQKALGAIEEYEGKVKDRGGALEGYYGEKEDLLGQTYDLQRKQLGLSEEGLDIKREGIGLQKEQLGLQGDQLDLQGKRLDVQESQSLNQFFDQAYNLRSSGEAQTAISGLAGSRISQRGQERREATLGGMMESQQDMYGMQREGLGIQREGLGVQGRQLDLSMSGINLEQKGIGLKQEGLGLSEAGSLADLLKSKGVEMSGIEDLLYQIETERLTYEGVGEP